MFSDTLLNKRTNYAEKGGQEFQFVSKIVIVHGGFDWRYHEKSRLSNVGRNPR
jgi:hypothetical protein